jgi:inhibitor of KinA
VCYAERFALDLEELVQQKHLSKQEIIQLHTSITYRVYMIGFLPGFAYMGEVDEKIAMPRRQQPRTAVPEGSVGIAGAQTGIYPFTSPGGWNIIGRTPLKLFDKDKEEPTFFKPGDEVTFYSITEDEFAHYQSRTV